MKNVTLILDDGSRFHGKSFGYEKPVAGEVVFNTAMTGYPESLTDPSYAGQLMTLTYPLVGNYGVPPFSIEPNGLATVYGERTHPCRSYYRKRLLTRNTVIGMTVETG